MKAIFFLSVLIFTLWPTTSDAVSLSVVAREGAVRVGDVISVDVLLDPEGETINGIEGNLLYSKQLQLERVEYGKSPVSFWLVRPSARGEYGVTFAGILPGGYLGNLSPEWRGYRAGTLMTLHLKAMAPGAAEVVVEGSTTITKHDGLGTPLSFTSTSLSRAVLQAPQGYVPSGGVPGADTAPPSPFYPAIIKETTLFDGDYAVVFATQDEESGVQRYQIAETRNPFGDGTKLAWVDAESPARLTDQFLTSGIYVKAIDVAGNERVEYVPASFSPVADILAIAFALVGILVVLAVFRRLRLL